MAKYDLSPLMAPVSESGVLQQPLHKRNAHVANFQIFFLDLKNVTERNVKQHIFNPFKKAKTTKVKNLVVATQLDLEYI